MAITAQQRSDRLRDVIVAAMEASGVSAPAPLSVLSPGTTPAQVLAAIVSAIGTTEDAFLTTVSGNLVAYLNTIETADQATVTAVQNQITAVTVV